MRSRLICLINNLLIRQYALTQMCHTVLQRSRLDINNLLMRHMYQHKLTTLFCTMRCLLTIYSSQMCYTVLQRRRFMYQQKIAPMCYTKMCLLTICSSQMCYTVLQRSRLKCLINNLLITNVLHRVTV